MSRILVIEDDLAILRGLKDNFVAEGYDVLVAEDGAEVAYPDTLVGTDSHTTMINSLGILGWGVGGIEAEAVMLGQPYYMSIPEVIGVKMVGELPEGVTATDLVLKVTEMLREHGVVEKFVEYFGPGMKNLSVTDRATISNMTPEYGATAGMFYIDEQTIDYLKLTGRQIKAEQWPAGKLGEDRGSLKPKA